MPKDIFTYFTQVFLIPIIQIMAFYCLPSSRYHHQALWNLFVVLSSSHLSPWSENPCHWRSSTWKYIDVMHILWYSTIAFIHYIQHYKAVPIIPYYSPVILSLTVDSGVDFKLISDWCKDINLSKTENCLLSRRKFIDDLYIIIGSMCPHSCKNTF